MVSVTPPPPQPPWLSPLLTDQQIARCQRTLQRARRRAQCEVQRQVLRKGRSGGTAPAYETVLNVPCRLFPGFEQIQERMIAGGIASIRQTFVYVAPGTDIRPSDRLLVTTPRRVQPYVLEVTGVNPPRSEADLEQIVVCHDVVGEA